MRAGLAERSMILIDSTELTAWKGDSVADTQGSTQICYSIGVLRDGATDGIRHSRELPGDVPVNTDGTRPDVAQGFVYAARHFLRRIFRRQNGGGVSNERQVPPV